MTDLTPLLNQYRQAILAETVELQGIPLLAPTDPVPLNQLYIRLQARTLADSLEPAEALAQHRQLIILGPSGAGKSTLLRYLAYQAAGRPDGPLPYYSHYLTLVWPGPSGQS